MLSSNEKKWGKIRFRVEVQESPIHGLGLFAEELIPAGRFIGHYDGPVVDEDGPHVLWVEQEDGSYRGIDGRNELRFVNHWPTPNAEFDSTALVALNDIEPGEEICVHYGEDWEDCPHELEIQRR